MGRLKESIRVLLGQRTTPLQIEAEWLEYKMIFESLLERWSASLAREAKKEKARIERMEPGTAAAPPAGSKAELRARAAALRGLPARFQQRSLELETPEEKN